MPNQLPPWLTEAEINDLCTPLTQHAAQIRYIERLGIPVRKKPNGAPLVMRSQFEEILAPANKSKAGKTQPNRAGLQLAFRKP